MSRKPRLYMPGMVFHLTARTTGREHWFDPGTRIVIRDLMADAMRRTDTQLLAYVVMSNHLHMVVRQGMAPLNQLMQPLLRRVALLVRRTHRIEGHVFERRFRDTPCTDPRHVRAAIVYTHLNPARAGLSVDEVYDCSEPAGQALQGGRPRHRAARSRRSGT